jgi:hypothetical protein
MRCSFFDQSRSLLRSGGVDRVTSACNFDLVAVGPRGIPAFEAGADGSIFCRYQHPARFASPRRRGNDRFEIVGCVEHLRSRHESSLLTRYVGGEVLMKLCGIEVSETVSRLLYRSRLAEVTWESFPSSASLSPASGMWAATYTNPATDGSVPASVITAPP